MDNGTKQREQEAEHARIKKALETQVDPYQWRAVVNPLPDRPLVAPNHNAMPEPRKGDLVWEPWIPYGAAVPADIAEATGNGLAVHVSNGYEPHLFRWPTAPSPADLEAWLQLDYLDEAERSLESLGRLGVEAPKFMQDGRPGLRGRPGPAPWDHRTYAVKFPRARCGYRYKRRYDIGVIASLLKDGTIGGQTQKDIQAMPFILGRPCRTCFHEVDHWKLIEWFRAGGRYIPLPELPDEIWRGPDRTK